MWEAVADESYLSFLNILLNRVKEFLLANLVIRKVLEILLAIARVYTSSFPLVQRGISTIMLRIVFCSLIGRVNTGQKPLTETPKNGYLLCVERDIMEWRNWNSISLNVHPVL